MNSGRKYYFLKIAELLNITRAAEQLMVSQPSLTQYLNRLEAELDIKLVDRNYTPLRLTRAGQLYRDYLSQAQELEKSFGSELELLKLENRSPLRIGIPLQKRHEGISASVLRFCNEHPMTDVRIWEGTSSTVRDKVIKGELDLGFAHTVNRENENCITQVLKTEKIIITCHKDNPIVKGHFSSRDETLLISPAALNTQLFFQMAPEYYLYTVSAAHMEQHGINPAKRLVMSNLHGILESILQNPTSGFCYMPDYVFDEHWPRTIADSLAYLRLDREDFGWYFSMLRKIGKTPTRDARSFWDCVLDICCEKT